MTLSKENLLYLINKKVWFNYFMEPNFSSDLLKDLEKNFKVKIKYNKYDISDQEFLDTFVYLKNNNKQDILNFLYKNNEISKKHHEVLHFLLPYFLGKSPSKEISHYLNFQIIQTSTNFLQKFKTSNPKEKEDLVNYFKSFIPGKIEIDSYLRICLQVEKIIQEPILSEKEIIYYMNKNVQHRFRDFINFPKIYILECNDINEEDFKKPYGEEFFNKFYPKLKNSKYSNIKSILYYWLSHSKIPSSYLEEVKEYLFNNNTDQKILVIFLKIHKDDILKEDLVKLSFSSSYNKTTKKLIHQMLKN